MMYRVILLVTSALALAGCSSTPDWLSLDALKPAPITDTVRFESEPAGADAKVADGQTCRTPCSLALPVNSSLTVTFSMAGYQPESETIEPIVMTGSPTQLRPNPVVVELTPAPPPAKPLRKPAAPKKKKTAPKTSSTTRPKPSAPATPAAASAAPQAQQAPQQPGQGPSPWPSTPQPR